jgi:hypothetical protein
MAFVQNNQVQNSSLGRLLPNILPCIRLVELVSVVTTNNVHKNIPLAARVWAWPERTTSSSVARTLKASGLVVHIHNIDVVNNCATSSRGKDSNSFVRVIGTKEFVKRPVLKVRRSMVHSQIAREHRLDDVIQTRACRVHGCDSMILSQSTAEDALVALNMKGCPPQGVVFVARNGSHHNHVLCCTNL